VEVGPTAGLLEGRELCAELAQQRVEQRHRGNGFVISQRLGKRLARRS